MGATFPLEELAVTTLVTVLGITEMIFPSTASPFNCMSMVGVTFSHAPLVN